MRGHADCRCADVQPGPACGPGAGSSYLLGLASMRGAFHPKVSVLAGPERALIGIGSGNVTMNGWHLSDEACTVIRADREGGAPAIVAGVATWLRALLNPHAGIGLGPLAADSVRRTAAELERLVMTAPVIETGHRLVSTSPARIVDQLPVDPVVHLDLYAPFHDPNGAALTALLERYAPRSVRIAVQPGRTVIDLPMLEAIALRSGVSLICEAIDLVPYRHGKVIEGVRADGTRWGVVGSPNVTAAALLRQLSSGGNCEVAVVCDQHVSVMPPAAITTDPGTVPVVTLSDAGGDLSVHDDEISIPVIVEASTVGGRVTVLLDRPAPPGLTIRISRYEELPEQFVHVGSFEPGMTSAVFDLSAAAGSRLWLVLAERELKDRWVPLTDPEAVTRRLRPTGRDHANGDLAPVDIYGNVAIAERWLTTLAQVLIKRQSVALPVVRGAEPGPGHARVNVAQGWQTVNDPDVWARYCDDAIARLGESVYLLGAGGLPRLLSGPTAVPDDRVPVWFDRLDSAQIDESSTAEEVAEKIEELPTPARPSPRDRTRAEQARYRRWLAQLVSGIAGSPAIDRSARTGLLLMGTKLAIWDEAVGPYGWYDLLATATRSLPGPDIPQVLETQIGSLAAVCLYWLFEASPPDERGHNAETYRTTATVVRDLLRLASIESVTDNLKSLETGGWLTADPQAVMAHRDSVLAPDQLHDVVRRLERVHPQWEVSVQTESCLRVDGTFSNPGRAAAEALSLLDSPATLAVRAVSSRGTRALAVRHSGSFTIVTEQRAGLWYRTYQLSARVSPLTVMTDESIEQNARLSKPPWNRPSDRAIAAIAAADLELDSLL